VEESANVFANIANTAKMKRRQKKRLTCMPLMAKNERIKDDSYLAMAVLHAALHRDALCIEETGKAGLDA
jgi:hypothetical protein